MKFLNPINALLSALLLSLSLPVFGGQVWTYQDIGSCAYAGKSEVDPVTGAVALSGSGVDLAGAADSFQFLYQTVTGDAQVVIKVPRAPDGLPGAKVGIMFRNSLASGAIHETVCLTQSGTCQLQARRLTGSGTTLVRELPNRGVTKWLKLTRVANVFTAYVSSDSKTWEFLGSDTVPMTPTAYVGLVSTSGGKAILGAANAESVELFVGAKQDVATPVAPAVRVTADPAAISLNWAGGSDDIGIKSYDILRDGAVLASVPAPASSWTDNTAVSGVLYSYSVVAYDAAGKASAPSAAMTGSLASAPARSESLDLNQDVGKVGRVGASTYNATTGEFAIQGAGTGISGNADGFNFSYQPLTGDGMILAKVATQGGTVASAKAGLMFREGMAVAARNVALVVTPAGTVALQSRTTAGGGTGTDASLSGRTAPQWLKLIRTGSVVAGYVSNDGVAWEWVGARTIALGATLQVGLAVASGSETTLCKAGSPRLRSQRAPSPTRFPPAHRACLRSLPAMLRLPWGGPLRRMMSG